MSNKKPFLSYVVRASLLPALLFTSTLSFAATDAEIADLKARIATLETTPSWTSASMQEVDPLSIHGFVNAGISSANNDGATDLSGGIGDDLEYQAHQSFGLQVSYKLDERTDVVGQLLGRGYQDNFNIRMNWAYLGHSLLEDKGPLSSLKLRMGRMPADIYMISEYYDVGYAYPWVVPPRPVYGLLGGLPYDGIDLAANFSLPKDWNMQFKTYIGSVDQDPVAGNTNTRFDLDKIAGFNMILERDAWRLRLGYGQAIVNYQVCSTCVSITDGTSAQIADFDTLSNGYNSVEAGFAQLEALAAAIPGYVAYSPTPITDTADNLGGSFSGVGFNYDDGTWLVMGEYTLQRWDTYNPDMDLSYLTVGRRIGEFMPYLTASQAEVEDDSDGQALIDQLDTIAATLGHPNVAGQVPGLTVPQQVAYGTLVATIPVLKDNFTSLNVPQTVYSVGIRYDFAPGATAKLQVDQITGFEDTRGDLESTYVSHFSIQAAF
jgi:hypothetical protein